MRTFLQKLSLRLVLVLTSVAFSFFVNGQQIPNSSFENWSVTSFYENPAGYNTTNFQSYFTTGAANVTKTTDAHAGSFAARLETVGSGGNIIPGGLFLGQPGGGGLGGGIPYSQRPDSMSFYTKYNMTSGDTATIFIVFQKLSNPIVNMSMTLTGSQATYTKVSLPISWFVPLVNPDTMAFIAITSNNGSQPGSIVYLDDLQLIGATQQLPNPGFENWLDLSADSPDNWMSSNAYTIMGSGVSVSKSTDHIDGLYSVKLTNAIGPQGDTTSYITNGGLGGNGPEGGTPVNQNPSKLTFYFKYQPVGSDSALAFAKITRWDSPTSTRISLDSNMIRLGTHATWTYYELPFNYAGFPHADSIVVAFAGGQVDESGTGIQLGSTLWVDNVQIEYGPIGINDPVNQSFGIYPNPVTDQINIEGDPGSTVFVEILSMEGKLLKSLEIIPGAKTDMSDLKAGCYLYRITTGSATLTGKFVKI